MIGTLFRVGTEFKFEIGSALLGTQALTTGVDNLNTAITNAQVGFQKMSIGLVGSMVQGPYGGVLGVLTTAVKSSEEFRKSQIQLANVLGRGNGTFAERMAFAADKMETIRKKANEFGLDATSLVGLTKTLTPALTPKMGLKGVDASIDLGRVFAKASPGLGINAEYGVDQLRRLTLGLDASGNQLFEILTADTKAMREFAGAGKNFQKLPLTERVKRLTEAFNEFAGDSEAVDAMMQSVGGQFQIMQQNLTGMFGVFKPIGDVLRGPIIQGMTAFNKLVDTNLRFALNSASRALAPFTGDLERMAATAGQLGKFKSDFETTKSLVGFIGIFLAISHTLKFLGIQSMVVSGIFSGLAAVFRFLMPILMAVVGFLAANFIPIMSGLVYLLSSIAVPALALMGVLQFLSRTMEYVRIEFAKSLTAMSDKFAVAMETFTRLMSIFDDGFDTLARLAAISPLTDAALFVFDKFISLIQFFADTLAFATATIVGSMVALMETVNQLKNFLSFKGFSGAKIKEAYSFGAQAVFERVYGDGKDKNAVAAQANTNIAKIEIKNEFRELMEPDRIAFALKDQLMKTAQAPTQARGRSFTRAATAGAFGGG